MKNYKVQEKNYRNNKKECVCRRTKGAAKNGIQTTNCAEGYGIGSGEENSGESWKTCEASEETSSAEENCEGAGTAEGVERVCTRSRIDGAHKYDSSGWGKEIMEGKKEGWSGSS